LYCDACCHKNSSDGKHDSQPCSGTCLHCQQAAVANHPNVNIPTYLSHGPLLAPIAAISGIAGSQNIPQHTLFCREDLDPQISASTLFSLHCALTI
jgi:hypothetical protein